VLALQEPMAGPVQPILYPVMWAADERLNFLRTPEAMRAVIQGAGFRVREWRDVTAETAGPSTGAAVPVLSIPRIVMGEALDAIIDAGNRNREQGRIVMIHAVLDRA